MPYSYKLNVFLTQTGVVLFLKVAHPPPPTDGQIPPCGGIPPRLGTTGLGRWQVWVLLTQSSGSEQMTLLSGDLPQLL